MKPIFTLLNVSRTLLHASYIFHRKVNKMKVHGHKQQTGFHIDLLFWEENKAYYFPFLQMFVSLRKPLPCGFQFAVILTAKGIEKSSGAFHMDALGFLSDILDVVYNSGVVRSGSGNWKPKLIMSYKSVRQRRQSSMK